ncbi:MAG: hypothetical protein HY544_02795 [Candidatus Diapherotrites archaeon]|uniref:Ig-like domain repeat protein n=1 Tax=Candidatus Iainarchaeum sp. TaxID=3101447 RepID=A0A8T3YL93_9ARCH|nr:hypothetical protein [Candidatus Diapherotrites archaeon]
MRKIPVLLSLVLLSAIVAAAAPTLTSPGRTAGQWSDNSSITMNVSYPDASQYSYEVDSKPDTVPDTVPETSVSVIYVGSKADGTYWFHARALSPSGWSDAAHFELKVDSSGPTMPFPATATALADGAVSVSWTPSSDAFSGVAYYNVYRSNVAQINDNGVVRDFTIRDSVAVKVADKFTGTEYKDSNFSVGKGRTFFYKIQPVDNASNPGAITPMIVARSASLCGLALSMSAQLKDKNLHVSVSSDGAFRGGKLLVTEPSGGPAATILDGVSGASAEAWYGLSGKINGDYNLFFSSYNDSYVPCSVQKVFTFDDNNPKVKINSPANDKDINGVLAFSISSSDEGQNASGLDKVSLYAEGASGEKLAGNADMNGQAYSVDWNTLDYDNGRYKVTARAFDKAGNKAEDSKYYVVRNTFLDKARFEKAISDANSSRSAAIAFINGLEKKNINLPSLLDAVFAADFNVSHAKSVSGNEFTLGSASSEAEAAAKAYSAIQSRVAVSTYNSSAYEYKPADLNALIKAAGLEGALADSANSYMAKITSTRKLEVLEVKFDGNSFYRANMAITLTNVDKNSLTAMVVEPIPKKFAASASDINSHAQFTILRGDPLIAFSAIDLNAGESYTLTYSLSSRLTRVQADALVSSKVVGFYVSPPVVLPGGSDVSSLKESLFSRASSVISGIAGIEWTTKNLIIAGIAIVLVLGLLFIVLVAAVAAIYFFYIKKKL